MTATYAQRLRDARRDAGLSQNQLAYRAQVAQPNLSRYENGRSMPDRPVQLRIAAVLDDERVIGDLVTFGLMAPATNGKRRYRVTHLGRRLLAEQRAS